MTRLTLVFAGLSIALVATVASAQSYPYAQQQYGAYGPGMPPAAFGPGMPPQAMYGASGQYPAAPAPFTSSVPDGRMEAAQAAYYQQAMHSQAVAAPPRPKLPPGVKDENGLLYYNGRPYGDVNYQQMYGPNPYQQVAYQQGMPSVMSGGGGPNGGYSPGAMPMGNGMQMQGEGEDGSCNNGGGDGCDCDSGTRHGHHCLHHWLFPGKDGYVWSGGFDNLGMTRDIGTERILAQNTSTLDTEFNSHQMHFDPSWGGKAFVELMGPSGIGYQAVYMKLATLVADASIGGADDLQIPFPLASTTVDFFGANQMIYHYTSSIQSGEINVIYPWGNFQVLGGFRYFGIDESFRITAVNNVTFGTSDFTADAFNQMYGGQIGAQGQWQLFGLINFDFVGKVGIFGNITAERQKLFDLNNTTLLRDTAGDNKTVSYVGELAVQGVIPLGPSLSVHAGYGVMFINQIALAPDQFDFGDQLDSGTHVDQRGDIILHGVNLGLTAVW